MDEFTCEGRSYGYYADVANECQIFHICYPVQYPDGQEEMLKWSFICPEQTVFDQVPDNGLWPENDKKKDSSTPPPQLLNQALLSALKSFTTIKAGFPAGGLQVCMHTYTSDNYVADFS